MGLNSAETVHGYDSFREGDKKVVMAHWKAVCFHHSQCQVLSLLYWGTAPHPTDSAAQRKLRAVTLLLPPSLSWIRATTLLWWWAWICFDSSLLLLACLETYWPFPIELKVSQLGQRAGKQEEEIFNREPCQSCAGSSSEHCRTWQEKSHRAGSGLFIFANCSWHFSSHTAFKGFARGSSTQVHVSLFDCSLTRALKGKKN